MDDVNIKPHKFQSRTMRVLHTFSNGLCLLFYGKVMKGHELGENTMQHAVLHESEAGDVV